MDTTGTMSNQWIPSKVGLDQELPVMLNAPFASIKQENYYTGDTKQEVARDMEEEWEGCKNNATITLTDNATGKSIIEASSIISPMRINHRVQIDVIEMQDNNEFNGHKHVLIYEEQYSKFIVLKALKSAHPGEVANEIVDIVTTIGAPRIIQSGNGRDYAEQVVREIRILLRDFCVVHGDAAKNAEVRRDFKTILKSWITKNPGRSLRDCLRTVQITENTTANLRFGKIPSQLFFGRNICDDLRRTIGAKGSTINISSEEDTIMTNSNQNNTSLNNTNQRSLPITINEIDNNDESTRTNKNGFNFVNVKTELPLTPEKNGVIHSKVEKTLNSEKREMRCKICEKQYMRLGSLRNHMKTHTVGSFDCVICDKSFDLSSLYDKHMKELHENDNDNGRITDRLREIPDDEEEDRSAKKSRMEEKTNDIAIERKNEKRASLRSFERKPMKIRESTRQEKSDAKTTTKLNENALLKCTYCKQKFNFPSVLKRHMRSHTNERPYVCQVCNKSFKQLGHLSQHSFIHTDYCSMEFDTQDTLKLDSKMQKNSITNYRTKEFHRLFECDICKKVFTTKSILERHIFTHTHERQFSCKICGKRFKQAGHVKSHMLVHTGERKFECTVCTKRFSLSNSLKKHMYVHNGGKPYQCDVCGARFLEKRNLNGHMMTHTNERPFSCKICGKRYTLADTLRRHISAAHEDGRTYQCEICAKMFKQLAHLSVHKKVHNDERPFQCHLCEKNFKHKNVLKSHLAIHANVRPFECDICKATFVRKTNLQTHIASAHMNERPYVCTICNKRFKQISHLNGHIVVHSNSMPYKCDFCDRRCNRLDNLKKHMRLHTKNKE